MNQLIIKFYNQNPTAFYRFSNAFFTTGTSICLFVKKKEREPPSEEESSLWLYNKMYKRLERCGEEECPDEPVAQNAAEVTHERNPAHAFHIPSESDFFQSHDDNAGRRSDNQDRTAHAGTVGQ